MNRENLRIFFSLLRSAICSTDMEREERENFSKDQLQALFNLASRHDVSHLLCLGLQRNNLIPETQSGIEKFIFNAVYRHEQIKHEYEILCNAFEKMQIPFLPLKGAVMRKYYPEAWMRTSCDIDILVHEKDLDRANRLLAENYGYTYQGKGSHDMTFYSQIGVHLELHYDLIEDGRSNGAARILSHIWDTALLREGSHYWYEMPDEMFCFYHIAHMAKHFENGGCGIRPFIDLWLLDNLSGRNEEKRNELLAQGNLQKFTEAARRLCRVWFEGKDYDSLSHRLENYVLSGGVYGNDKNRIVLQQQKKGGRMRYVISRIFLPYDVIKYHYPVLEKHAWLLPVMQVRRWFKLVFGGRLKYAARELGYNNKVSGEEGENARRFLEDLGL